MRFIWLEILNIIEVQVFYYETITTDHNACKAHLGAGSNPFFYKNVAYACRVGRGAVITYDGVND